MSKKTVLILGGTGFVGSYLRTYLEGDYRVVTTSRSGTNADHAFELGQASSTRLFDEVAPDAIVNCTVCYGPTLEACFEVNVREQAGLFMALRSRPLHFLQISSVSAAPANRHLNDYSLTKFMADELLSYGAASAKLRVTILRFAQIFDSAGGSEKSQPGLHAWVASLRKGEPIKVYDRDAQKRSYLPVQTAAGAVELAIRHPIYGTHDVIAPEAYTPRELAHLLAGLAGCDASRIELVDKSALGYAIPAVSAQFEGWMSEQTPVPQFLARFFAKQDPEVR